MSAFFDHAATSPMRPEALEAYVRHADLVGNPSALHREGQRARRALEDAREALADVVGCLPAEIIWTSGGSEADSIAVLGGWRASGRPRALVSAVEHDAVLGARGHGAELLPVGRDGAVDVEAAESLVDDRVGLVSVMLVNNETGLRQPVEAMRRCTLRHGVWLHTDAVQALGHVPVRFDELGVDMMTLSAHKLGGPVGIGALVARRDVQPTPIGLGGGQERRVRSGTAPVALAAAFAAAARAAVGELEETNARLRMYGGRVRQTLRSLGATVNAPEDRCAPHIVNATFPGIRAADLLLLLDQRGIQASVGSACRAGVHQPSQVLLAMGRSEDEAASTLRFSMGWNTSDTDVDRLCDELGRALRLAELAF